jgi:hypothetical protein
MPDTPTVHPVAAEDAALATEELAYEPIAEDDDWPREPDEELSPRPRRRLLGAGGNPIALGLAVVLLIACGFIGGVLVEKGQTSSSTTAGSGLAGFASRFASLRGSGSGTGVGGTQTGGKTGAGALAGAFGGAGGATVGEVSFVSGSTLYVTDAEGNTVKVATSAASSITKTVKTDVHGIHPGETVVVRGSKGANGAVDAESISVGGAGGTAGGGLASLFAGAGASTRGSSPAGGSSRSGAGGPALFGE